MKRLLFVFVTVGLLCGCASLTGGRYYDYHYTTKPDGTKDCHLIIDSGSLVTGAQLDICNADGHATAGATGVTQGDSRIDIAGLAATVGAMVQQAIRGQAIQVPAPPTTPPNP